jgi:hypothetical protein
MCSETMMMTHSTSCGCALLAAFVLGACAYPVSRKMPLRWRSAIPSPSSRTWKWCASIQPVRAAARQGWRADLERFARDYLDNGSGAWPSQAPPNPDGPHRRRPWLVAWACRGTASSSEVRPLIPT